MGVEAEQPARADAGDAEGEAPGAFEVYRRAHPGVWERVLGDVAPGLVVTEDVYRRTSASLRDFLGVRPRSSEGDPRVRAQQGDGEGGVDDGSADEQA